MVPKTTWDFADRKDWPQEWLGSIEMKLDELARPMSSVRAWCPYLLVAASATVGLLGREGATLRRTVWPTLYYVLMTGIIALIAAYLMDFTDPLMAQ